MAELLALLLEETSLVNVEGMGRKKPIEMPRPDWVPTRRRTQTRYAGRDGQPARAVPDGQDAAAPAAAARESVAASNVIAIDPYKRAMGVFMATRRPPGG
jgi:hypothetical protein